MQIIRGIQNIHTEHQGCVLSIGNFDGVHVGHQALLERLVRVARDQGLPATVITFEPLPREFFAKHAEERPARLTKLREKLLIMQACGVERLIVIRFNQEFASFTKEQFVELLVKRLGVHTLIIGQDFHFAAKRAGNVAYLKQVANFNIETVEDFKLFEQRVSSSQVREALAKDHLRLAAELLGRPYSMFGRVVHGAKLGRQLGFPTANIELHRSKTPVHGVYAVHIYGVGKKILEGVANVGERPAVGGTRTLLEVFIFDFKRDIYGCPVQVEFLHKIRNEEHYDSLDKLKDAIKQDVVLAKAYFARERV